MKRYPYVSIIMGIYDRKIFLREAIESILEQSETNFELILINDGSKEDLQKYLDTFKDSRIVRVHHDRNYGIAAVRNEGVGRARGEWITFFDSDDLMPLDSLRIRLKAIENGSDYRVVFGKTSLILNRKSSSPGLKRLLGRERVPKRQVWMTQCYRYARKLGEIPKGVARSTNCIPWPLTSQLFHSSVFRKVGKFDQSLILSDDTDFAYRVNDVMPSRFVDAVVLYYRRHRANFSLTVNPLLLWKELRRFEPSRSQP